MTFLNRVTKQINRRGGEILSIRQNHHNVIQFQTTAGRGKISTAGTPSDRNAIKNVERDIARKFSEIACRGELQIEASPIMVEPNRAERIRQAPHAERSRDRRLAVSFTGVALQGSHKTRTFPQHDAHIIYRNRILDALHFGFMTFTHDAIFSEASNIGDSLGYISNSLIFNNLVERFTPYTRWKGHTLEAKILRSIFDEAYLNFLESPDGRAHATREFKLPKWKGQTQAEKGIQEAIKMTRG